MPVYAGSMLIFGLVVVGAEAALNPVTRYERGQTRRRPGRYEGAVVSTTNSKKDWLKIVPDCWRA